MAGRHVRGRFSVRRSLRRLLASTALGLLLALVPVEVGVDEGGVSPGEPVALAKGGNSGGIGGGIGDGIGGGHAWGHDKDRGGESTADGSTADGMRLMGDAAKQAARNRFNQLTGKGNNGIGNIGTDRFVLTDGQTLALLQRGWDVNAHASHGEFENHGQYVSTMVHIAKELGYNGVVGALQAKLLPADWYGMQLQWRSLADGADKNALEYTMAGLLEVSKTGEGPKDYEWATVNLDVDGDGVITKADLAAAERVAAEGGVAPLAFFWPDAGP